MNYYNRLKSGLFLPALMCGVSGFFYIYDYFIQVSPSVITHELMKTWSLNVAQLGTLLSFFLVAYMAMQLPAGFLLSRFGVRKTMATMVFISSLGLLIFSLAHAYWLASFGRALMGAGCAFAYLGVLNLSAQWLPHRYYAMIAGVISLAGALGSSFAQAPMAYWSAHYAWKHIFLYTAVIGFLLSLLYWLVIRDNKDYQFNIKEEPPRWNMVFTLFRSKQAVTCFIISFCAWTPVIGIAGLWAVPYLVKVQQLDTQSVGEHLAFFWIALGVGSPLFGFITAHVKDFSKPISVCFALGALGFVGFLIPCSHNIWLLDISLVCLGLACAAQALSFGALKSHVTRSEFGCASSICNLSAIFAGFVVKVSAGYVLHGMNPSLGNNMIKFSYVSYLAAFSIVGFFLLVGLLLSLFSLNGRRTQPSAR